jgi:hypothetical protein
MGMWVNLKHLKKQHKLVVTWQCYIKYVFCVLHPFVAPVGVS